MTRTARVVICIAALSILGIGAYAVWGDRRPEEAACRERSPQPKIVAFGDSLAAGFGAVETGGFITLVSRSVGVPILNLARNGETTATALERLQLLTTQNPDVVIISLGGNDGLRRMSPAETESNLQTLIETLTRNGAIVVLLGVPGGLPFNDPHPAIFERLSTLPGVVYVSNILRGLLGNQELMIDPIHPNDAGYAAIADRVAPAILTACAQLSTMTD